nr:hypothetical protein [Pandoravirus aubagnensis]
MTGPAGTDKQHFFFFPFQKGKERKKWGPDVCVRVGEKRTGRAGDKGGRKGALYARRRRHHLVDRAPRAGTHRGKTKLLWDRIASSYCTYVRRLLSFSLSLSLSLSALATLFPLLDEWARSLACLAYCAVGLWQ